MKASDRALLALQQARKDQDVSALIEFLRDPELRDAAAHTLEEIGDRRAIPPLRPLLAARDPQTRAASAQALGSLGDGSVLPRLKEMAIADPQDFVRSWAIDAVRKLGGHGEIDFLMGLLADPDLMARHAAAYSLGRLGDPAAIEAIDAARRKESWRHRKPYRIALDRLRK